jgi:hypothetical protein
VPSRVALSSLLAIACLSWTTLSLYFVIVLEQPPALDAVGILRTVVLAPGYVAFLVAAALATVGVVMNPWVIAGIVGVAIGALASLPVVRAWQPDSTS